MGKINTHYLYTKFIFPMNSKIILFLVITFMFPELSFSQEVLTLEEAIKIALRNNFSINIARNEAEIANNNFTIGHAGMLPGLDANGSYSESINNTTQEFFDGRRSERNDAESSTLTAGISLNWTIYPFTLKRLNGTEHIIRLESTSFEPIYFTNLFS